VLPDDATFPLFRVSPGGLDRNTDCDGRSFDAFIEDNGESWMISSSQSFSPKLRQRSVDDLDLDGSFQEPIATSRRVDYRVALDMHCRP